MKNNSQNKIQIGKFLDVNGKRVTVPKLNNDSRNPLGSLSHQSRCVVHKNGRMRRT